MVSTSASNKNFDFDAAFDQEFVVLRERIEPIDPDKPTQPQTNQLIQTIQIHQNGQIQSKTLLTKMMSLVL